MNKGKFLQDRGPEEFGQPVEVLVRQYRVLQKIREHHKIMDPNDVDKGT